MNLNVSEEFDNIIIEEIGCNEENEDNAEEELSDEQYTGKKVGEKSESEEASDEENKKYL